MTKPQTHWSNTEERGTVLGIKILLWIYRLFGRKVLWFFMFPVIIFLFATGKSARQGSKAFFQRAHRTDSRVPDYSFSVGVRHFCTFADSAFDKLDAWLGRIDRRSISYNDEQAFPKIVSQGKGAVLIGSHLGNLEVCRALGSMHYDITINVLVFTENAVKFNEALQSVNSDVSVNLIQVTQMSPELAMSLQDKVDNGEVIVIVGDRTSVTTSGRVEYIPFLGEEAPFSQGPFILASLLSCPVYWFFCLSEDDGFKVIFEHVSDEIKLPRKTRKEALTDLVTQYVKRLEFYALNYPYQWFNFFDFWQKDDAIHRTSKK